MGECIGKTRYLPRQFHIPPTPPSLPPSLPSFLAPILLTDIPELLLGPQLIEGLVLEEEDKQVQVGGESDRLRPELIGYLEGGREGGREGGKGPGGGH